MNRFLFILMLGMLVSSMGCQQTQPPKDPWESDVYNHHGMTPGGKLLLKAMEAHGGLEQWYANGVLSFRWTYFMSIEERDQKIDIRQKIDLSSMETLTHVIGTGIRFGWSEDSAWVRPKESADQIPARFWAHAPIYFVGLPLVFADQGTKAELLEDFHFESVNWRQVKVTFSRDDADASRDVYILLIHPEKNYVGGVRYTINSPYFKSSSYSNEKLLTLDHPEWVKGIYLPRFHRVFTMKEGRPLEKIRDAQVRETQFYPRGRFDFRPPVGAKKL